MKFLNLLMWVGQFGFSVIFPTLFFLLLGSWLQQRYSLGMWILVLLGIIGVMTSVSTAKACIKSLLKAASEAADSKEAPMAFNDHI